MNELRGAVVKSKEFHLKFIEGYTLLIERVNVLSLNTKFTFLYDYRRDLFSIGYNMEEKRLTNSYYDLLASEARQTSYIA